MFKHNIETGIVGAMGRPGQRWWTHYLGCLHYYFISWLVKEKLLQSWQKLCKVWSCYLLIFFSQAKPFYLIFLVCSDEVGFESWRIRDPAFTSSSYKSSRSYPWMARLHSREAWCAGLNDTHPFLQVSVLDFVHLYYFSIDFRSNSGLVFVLYIIF